MNKIWFVIISTVFFLFSFYLISTRNIMRIISESAPDFTQVWVSAGDLLASKEPYFDPKLDYPNAYPPITELFYLPLGALPYNRALAIFTYISFCAIVGSVYLAIKITAKKVYWAVFLLFLGLTFLSFPTKFSLGLGQANIIVLFLTLLAVFLETKPNKNSVLAGLSFGLAIALKPVFSFFLIFFAVQKSWKLIISSLITVLSIVDITLILWPFRFWVTWYQSTIYPIMKFLPIYMYVYPNQGIFGFLTRATADFFLRIYVTHIATFFLILTAIFLTLKNKAFGLGLSFFILSLLLFDTISWQHHFVWTIFPFVTLLYSAARSKNLWILVLLIFSLFLVSWNFKQPSLYPTAILSTQFYGGIILWIINFYLLIRQNKTTSADKGSIRYKIFEALSFLE